jgi:hypothetical protein
LPFDCQAGDVALIGDDGRQTEVSPRIVWLSWFYVDGLHVKAAELKRTGDQKGLFESLRLNLRCDVKLHPILTWYYQG